MPIAVDSAAYHFWNISNSTSVLRRMGVINGVVKMTRIALAVLLLLAAPAWAETQYLCYGEFGRPSPVSTEPGTWVCHEDEFGIIQCEELLYFTAGQFEPITVDPPVKLVFRDYESELDDDVATITWPDMKFNDGKFILKNLRLFYKEDGKDKEFFVVEVPDMNGDGAVDEQDKRLAEYAVEAARRAFTASPPR